MRSRFYMRRCVSNPSRLAYLLAYFAMVFAVTVVIYLSGLPELSRVEHGRILSERGSRRSFVQPTEMK
jgi:hypothetical protein